MLPLSACDGVVATSAQDTLLRASYPILAFDKARMGEGGAVVVGEVCPIGRVCDRVARRRVGGVAGGGEVIVKAFYHNNWLSLSFSMYEHIRVRSEDRAGADMVVVLLLLAEAVRDLESDKNLIFLHISHDVAKARSRVCHGDVSLLLSRCAGVTCRCYCCLVLKVKDHNGSAPITVKTPPTCALKAGNTPLDCAHRAREVMLDSLPQVRYKCSSRAEPCVRSLPTVLSASCAQSI
jgi:hypothetical protein